MCAQHLFPAADLSCKKDHGWAEALLLSQKFVIKVSPTPKGIIGGDRTSLPNMSEFSGHPERHDTYRCAEVPVPQYRLCAPLFSCKLLHANVRHTHSICCELAPSQADR